MPISNTRYVEITSGTAGSAAIAQRELIGLRFSTDIKTPVGSILRFADAGAVADYYGSGTPEAEFALQYFGYVSPAPASKPAALLFAAYAGNARYPTLIGSDKVASLADLKLITAGTMELTLGDDAEQFTGIDLSAATSFADVATTLQTKLRTGTGPQFAAATVTYDAPSGKFTIAGGIAQNGGVEVTSEPLSTAMGLVQAGRILSPGSAAQSAYDAFRRAEDVTDSFGTVSFARFAGGAQPDLAQAVELSEYIASLNIKYQLYWGISPGEASAWSAALIGTASTGLVLNGTNGQFKEAIPQAVAASVNYDRRNAAVNFMFRSPSVTMTADVTNDLEANVYDPLRVNYYGQTAMYGQNISFFQRGYLCGSPAVNPLDMGVHLNEQWLKSKLAADFLTLLITKGIVPAAAQGRADGLLLVNGAAEQALFNGTIIAGKDITEQQKIAIASITGDDLAWHDVQVNGYWADAQIVQKQGPSSLSEYVLQYTIVYSANEGVRKVEGSHNLIV